MINRPRGSPPQLTTMEETKKQTYSKIVQKYTYPPKQRSHDSSIEDEKISSLSRKKVHFKIPISNLATQKNSPKQLYRKTKKNKPFLVWKRISQNQKKIRSYKMGYIIYIENSNGNLKDTLRTIRNQKNKDNQNITSWIQVNKIKNPELLRFFSTQNIIYSKNKGFNASSPKEKYKTTKEKINFENTKKEETNLNEKQIYPNRILCNTCGDFGHRHFNCLRTHIRRFHKSKHLEKKYTS